MKTIPVSRPFIGKEEKELVLQAVERGELSGTFGEFVPRFEKEFAAYCGCQYGVATSNGTTALHLALATLGIKAGDEVLVQTFTNMASVFAIRYLGAVPVAVDIEPDTWNMNPELLEKLITPRTKAIMVVHVYGHPVDMDAVVEIAKKHNIAVLEDAAEAHGAQYKGRKIGSLGDIATFSFYANKILTTGEGGMIVTNSKELADKARQLGTLAYGSREHRFMHSAVGFNYRMPNTIAAIGCAQLERIEKIIEMKREMASFYNKALADISCLQLPVEKEYAKNVYWMYHVVLRGKAAGRRREVMEELSKRGVETREAFTPYNQQEIFIKEGLVKGNECPVANDIGANGFYIPSGTVISQEEMQYVSDALHAVIQ